MLGFLVRTSGQLKRKLVGGLSSDHRAGLKGIGWTTIGQATVVLVRLISLLVLSRLLAPEAYAPLGVALAISLIVELLSDLGIRQALIRHKHGEDPRYLWTGWWMNLIRGVALAVLLGAAAPLAGWVYPDVSELTLVLLALAIRPILYGLVSPGLPVLYRELHYKTILGTEVIQAIVSTAAGITAAALGCGMWSLIIGMLLGDVVQVCLTWVTCKRIPRAEWCHEAFRDLFFVGRQVFVNTLVMALWLYLDRLVGGRMLPELALGLYVVAMNLSGVVEALLSRFCDVYHSLLARQTDSEARLQWHRTVCTYVARWGMGIIAIGVVAAPWAIQIIFDSRWHEVGFLLSVLLVRLMVRGLALMQYQYILMRNKIYLETISYSVGFLTGLVLIVPLTWHWGLTGMALSVMISTITYAFVQFWLMARREQTDFAPLLYTLFWMGASLTAITLLVR